MVLVDKRPLRQPALPPLCEPSPHRKVEVSCTCAHSTAWFSSTIHKNIKKTYTQTQKCICSCVSHLPSVEHVVILCSELSHEM